MIELTEKRRQLEKKIQKEYVEAVNKVFTYHERKQISFLYFENLIEEATIKERMKTSLLNRLKCFTIDEQKFIIDIYLAEENVLDYLFNAWVESCYNIKDTVEDFLDDDLFGWSEAYLEEEGEDAAESDEDEDYNGPLRDSKYLIGGYNEV